MISCRLPSSALPLALFAVVACEPATKDEAPKVGSTAPAAIDPEDGAAALDGGTGTGTDTDTDTAPPATSNWKSPPQEILDVLHAPQLPWVWTAPSGAHLLLADPVSYPPLAELAAERHDLAGDPCRPGGQRRAWPTRCNLAATGRGSRRCGHRTGAPQGRGGPRRRLDRRWHRFALTVRHPDHIGVWVGSIDGSLAELEGVAVNPLFDSAVRWMPDQKRLLLRRIPQRGKPPKAPAIPAGPAILEGSGARSRSTYEARDLLKTAHDDALFSYYASCELVVVDPDGGRQTTVGPNAVYSATEFSPDGEFVLTNRLVGPWSHEVPWWRFARELEVRDAKGAVVATIASAPVATEVPAHGVRKGPRGASWRSTAAHELYWTEALDGGDPVAEVPHRDRLMRLQAPFTGEPKEVFKAEHRMLGWIWGAEKGTAIVLQRERIRRWSYTWLLDVDEGSSRLWFDLNEADSYASPGFPVTRPLPNGRRVFRQDGDAVYYSGRGATEEGDRPFLDLRSMKDGSQRRLFRGAADRYESFTAFAQDGERFVMRSESPTDVPNYYLATLGAQLEDAAPGEPTRQVSRVPITKFEDPTPELRQIKKRIVRYKRKDGVPLSFQLHLPPGYKEGTRVPPSCTRIRKSTPTHPPRDRFAGQRNASAVSRAPLTCSSCCEATQSSTAPRCRCSQPRDDVRHVRAAAGRRCRGGGRQSGGDRSRRSQPYWRHRA